MPPRLSTPHYDRAAYRRADDGWLAAAWERGRVLAVTAKSAALVDASEQALAFGPSSAVPQDAPRRFLGELDLGDGSGPVPYFAATVEPAVGQEESGQWRTLRDLGSVIDDTTGGMFAAAIGLEQWHQRHGHCPLCGTPTVESLAGWTRTCPQDGSTHFPRTDPAVIMLVTDDRDRALLGRSRAWPAGRFSTLAGFVEPGESLESAVVREVAEEVDVAITDITYVGSQPWPFPSSLMIGFFARLDGDPTLTCDMEEMAEAGWFTREEVRRAAQWTDTGRTPDPEVQLQAISPVLSISRYLVDEWLT